MACATSFPLIPELDRLLGYLCVSVNNGQLGDITLWAKKGPPSEIQHTLQSAIDITARYREERGLTLSSAKSEYIVVTNRKLPSAQEDRQLVTLSIKNVPIPRKPCIKVLGFWLQDDGKSKEWFLHTTQQLQQVHRLLKRTTRKLRGIKEHQLRRMTLALAIPRIMYQYPYIEITKTQKSKLETLLRQISRAILGTPQYAKSDRVRGTAILPDLEELAQIHREAQFTRLKLSAQGYALLRELGYDISSPVAFEATRPPWATFDQIIVEPVPRHMDRDTQTGRREARAQHLQETTGEWILYTDASPSQTGEGFRTGIASEGLPLSWGFHHNIKALQTTASSLRSRGVFPILQAYTSVPRHSVSAGVFVTMAHRPNVKRDEGSRRQKHHRKATQSSGIQPSRSSKKSADKPGVSRTSSKLSISKDMKDSKDPINVEVTTGTMREDRESKFTGDRDALTTTRRQVCDEN
ncbi:hypothetical protein HPB52_015606 [Rhipicephalus sanguineus]|uniref:Tick transposon n=1 Tax=Rhipicephalus sanguineus TaxID=34632 RepID=A0A9D4PMR2_RHISA|nr:hypothetical protein HPB52_015606 [Rhipicephalus sanguineus]